MGKMKAAKQAAQEAAEAERKAKLVVRLAAAKKEQEEADRKAAEEAERIRIAQAEIARRFFQSPEPVGKRDPRVHQQIVDHHKKLRNVSKLPFRQQRLLDTNARSQRSGREVSGNPLPILKTSSRRDRAPKPLDHSPRTGRRLIERFDRESIRCEQS